jgi:aminopeptidase
MPSGEVFTGPIEDSAEGVSSFDLPSSVGGVVVRGVRLRFEAGRVVEATADEGEDLLQAQLDTDPGARYLGEIGIGTNDRITAPILNTLYDEKIGGTVHLALGRSYPESGGTNHSAIHWDLITDLRRGGELLLDGEPFQRRRPLPRLTAGPPRATRPEPNQGLATASPRSGRLSFAPRS